MNPTELLKLALDHLKAGEDMLELARKHLPEDALGGLNGARGSTTSALIRLDYVKNDAREAIKAHEKAAAKQLEMEVKP